MSRNSRIVRNREKSKVDLDSKKVKIIASSILAAVILVIAIIIGIFKLKNHINSQIVDMNEKLSYEYFILSAKDGLGVIDKTGKTVIESKYNDIYIPNEEKDVFICYDDENNSKVLNQSGQEIFTDYENVQPINSSDNSVTEKYLLKYEKDGLYGMIDLDENLISEALYTEISSLDNRPGRILVKKDEKFGVMDTKGNLFIDTKYDTVSADDYCSSTDLYQKTGYIVGEKTQDGINYGYINYEGKYLLDTKYETIERALEYNDENIYLIAMQKGKKGVFKNKKKLIDLNFQDINYSDLSDVFIVNKNGKYGFFDRNGKVILKAQYEKYSIAGNYISVTKNDETQLFDINGNIVNTTSYTKMIETENPSYFIAEDENGYCSIISKDVKIDQEFIQVNYAFDNYFIFTDKTGKCGVIDALTQEIEINAKYDYIVLIEGTKTLQAIDGSNNFADIYSSKLEKIFSMSDAIVEKLDDQYTIIYSENDMKYFDKEGKIVENTDVYQDRNLYAIQQNHKWGFADSTGKDVVKCEYDIVTELNEYGFAGIKKDGKWGVIDENGKVIIEPTYELDIYYFPKFVDKYLLVESQLTYCEEI